MGRMLVQLATRTISADNPGVQVTLATTDVPASLRKPIHLLIVNNGAAVVYLTATAAEDGPTAVPIAVGSLVTLEGYCNHNLPFLWSAAPTDCIVTPFIEVT